MTHGFRVMVRFTLTRHNRDQLLPAHALARDLGAVVFQVRPLIQSGRAARMGGAVSLPQLRAATEQLARTAVPNDCVSEMICCPVSCSAGLRSKACGSVDKIYVDPDGSVGLCNFLPDDRRIGDLATEPLDAILARRTARLTRILDGETVPSGCTRYA